MTSRVADPAVWGNRVEVVPLGVLEEQPAASMLLDRMGRTGETELLAEATAVVNRLGRLPLAVHLAGSYLGSGVAEVGLAGYVGLLKARSVSLLSAGAPGWGEQDPRREVMSTWEISLDALARQGRGRSREVLRVLSFVAAGSVVPVSMLHPGVLADSGMVAAGEAGRAELAAALAGLRAVGLVESAPVRGGDGLLVHPLVAEVSRLLADRTGQRAIFLTAAAGLIVTAAKPLDPANPTDRDGWRVLAPHAMVVLDTASDLNDAYLRAQVVKVNNAVTYYLFAQGSYPAAIDHGNRVRSIAAGMLGAEHPDTLMSRNNLAAAYQAAGRLREAIPLCEATLAACERVLGAEHPDTLRSRNNLAAAYQAAGRLREAIPLCEATLAACERVLGAEHPDTLRSRNNLAAAYQAAGRLREAIPLCEATLAACERVLGAEHPDTLRSRNNLAYAYDAAGRLREAIPLYEATLAAYEQVLGAEHPDTLRSRNNLAYAYDAAGRLREAIPLYEATLAGCEQVLGAEHPDTLMSRDNLAGSYCAAGRLGEAIPLYEATLAGCEQVLGAEHPDTLMSRDNLAGSYCAAGRLGEAIPLYEATLAAYERVLGAEHPNTLTSRNNLATAYQAAGRLGEAIPLYEATLAACEPVLGAEHPNTLTSRNNLAAAYQAREEGE
ncbi:tetratricopeptide repeat protein [Plantactinospora sp. CA-290183]